MAEISKTEMSPFEKQRRDIIKKVFEYKLNCEANIVFALYKRPEEFYNLMLTLNDFSNNIWKVYFQIAYDLFMNEKKPVLDEITVGLYLEKHPKLREKFEEYGGYEKIIESNEYVKEDNLHGYVEELHKWNAVIHLVQRGFLINNLSDYADMSSEEIYDQLETFINHTFVSVDNGVKSYNAFEGLHELVDETDEGALVGLPLYNADILSNEISGLNIGHIYGIGANSGVGKTTTVINYIVPSIIRYHEKLVMIINEEDQKKVQRELLVWVANNVYKTEFHKYMLRNGRFSPETKTLLHKCAEWLEKQKDNKNLTIIPLESYSVNTVIKIIKKYASMGVKYFVLDTLKESSDSYREETHKSMMRDMVRLYDVVKPSNKNVALVVTYQLTKASIKKRYYTNEEIGQAKSIVDVMSVNIMMRRPFEDEFEGKHEIIVYRVEEKNGKTKIPIKLSPNKKYMLAFVCKNRFGATDQYQILSEYDMSTNTYQDIGICNVQQDW